MSEVSEMESWKSELNHAVPIGSIPEEDRKYGIPEQKKFPMPDKQHVISAIKFFNYVTPKYEKQLAKAILARMKEYGMSFDDFGVGEDNRFSKYIPKKDQELAHHGILGMKWGVRRFQNKDGSLTEAGKKRYSGSVLSDDEIDLYKKNVETIYKKEVPEKYYRDKKNILQVAKRNKEREKVLEEKKIAQKELRKTEYGLIKKSGDLSNIVNEMTKIKKELDKEADKFQNDPKLISKTAEDYIKSRNITDEGSKEYYRTMGGIDAAANLWSYYADNHKKTRELYDRQWELRGEFYSKSKEITNALLGNFSNEKLELTYQKFPDELPKKYYRTASEFVSNRLNDHLYDFVIENDYWENELKHHGILGQKWGVRRYQNEDGSLTPAGMKRRAQQIDKDNAKFLKKYGDTINKKVEKAVEPYMKIYAERELNTSLRKLKKNGKDSRNYINAYNKRLAQLMNTAVGDLRNPKTDYVVQFIAKRGEYGVHTALAHPDADMSRYKSGVYGDGRIAYRKEGVKTV